MFFLKKGSKGLSKKNIIYIENFIDIETKSRLKSKGFKCERFNVHDTKKKLSKDIKITQKIYLKFTSQIKLELEKSSRKKIDNKIIHLIFSKWLFYYISNSYYKFQILLKIKKKYPKFALLDIEEKNIVEEDKLLYAPNATILNFDLIKNIGKQLEIPSFEIKFSKIKELVFYIPSPEYKKDKFFLSFHIKNFLSKLSILISKLFYKNSILIHDDTLNFFNLMKLILKSKFKFSYLYFLENYTKELNDHSNLNILKLKSENRFENILLKNFNIYLPKGLFLLIDYCKNTDEGKKDKKNKNIVVSTRFYAAGFLNFKKFIIKNIFQNKLVAYQHGGSYGHEKNYFPEIAEKLISDYFATWGWKGKKTLALPLDTDCQYLTKKRKKPICLFTTISCTYNFLSYPNNPEMIPNYQMKPTFDLLSKISNKTSTTLRLPPYRHTWREGDFFMKIKNIEIDNHKKSFKQMALRSNFVIHNHFNTTALETLSLNIPTLIFNHRNLQEFNIEANEQVKKLVKANIFFYDHSKLLKFLKKNNYDLKAWWEKKEVQNVRKNFCKIYCNRRTDWAKEWTLRFNLINR
jgi:putative transferase (TIGR04331 family)